MITPKTGIGNGGDDSANPTGHTGQGGCAFCHNAGTDTSTGVNFTVYTNAETHHGTGLGDATIVGQSTTCTLCHGAVNVLDIRVCEACHGVKSLHNIQVNSPNPANPGTIVPGQENAYWGHIGNNSDCNGCHLNSSLSASAPYTGPVISDISDLSTYSVYEGVNTTITVTGSAFTSKVGTTELTSNVVITSENGLTITLTPTTITESSMEVDIPATLAQGNYDLRAVKESSTSNSVNLSVIPEVVITSAQCSNGVVTIKGSGFSGYVNAVDSGTSVQLGGRTCSSVNSWSDTEIVANCGTCSGTVVVNSVFGTASQQLELPPQLCNYVYSDWTACQPDGTQTRTYTKSPDGCVENPLPVTTQTCTYTPPTCTDFTYSAWSACVNGQQTRTVTSISPAGCVGGNPVLTQTCVSNQPPVANAGRDQSTRTNRSVKLNGSASKDPDGKIMNYVWNFYDDKSSASGKIVSHKFTAEGTYTVTLTVTDDTGATGTDTAVITVK
jgi:PKD repeat protein